MGCLGLYISGLEDTSIISLAEHIRLEASHWILQNRKMENTSQNDILEASVSLLTGEPLSTPKNRKTEKVNINPKKSAKRTSGEKSNVAKKLKFNMNDIEILSSESRNSQILNNQLDEDLIPVSYTSSPSKRFVNPGMSPRPGSSISEISMSSDAASAKRTINPRKLGNKLSLMVAKGELNIIRDYKYSGSIKNGGYDDERVMITLSFRRYGSACIRICSGHSNNAIFINEQHILKFLTILQGHLKSESQSDYFSSPETEFGDIRISYSVGFRIRIADDAKDNECSINLRHETLESLSGIIDNFWKLIHIVNQRTASLKEALKIMQNLSENNGDVSQAEMAKYYDNADYVVSANEVWDMMLGIYDEKTTSISGVWDVSK